MNLEWVRHPEWWVAVLCVLATAVAALTAARLLARRRRRRLGPTLRPGVSLGRDAALLLALAAIGAALLGPRLGEREVRVPASGIDLVLLFDVSRSMDARDVAPSRLARARQAGEALLARLAPGDRVALAFFAGRGVLASPLTPDREALVQLIGALDSDLLRPAGSNLASGLRAAAEAFDLESERPRRIFLLSDGEDPERRGELGSQAARRVEAPVFSAAFGSDAGATVPDRGLPLRDRGGTIVVSRRHTERLERLAAATGGAVHRANEWGELDLDAVVADLRSGSMADAEGMATRRVSAVRFWPLAALAFVVLACEGLPAPRRRAASGRLAGLAAAGLLLAGANGGDPDALEAALHARPGDAQLLIELGIDRLERGRREDALRAFRAAAVGAADPELAALAWYDAGVAALEEGALEEAREAFLESLALDPEDREARFNLEWTQAALASDPPAPKAPPPLSPPPPEATEKDDPEASSEPEPAPQAGAEQRRRWLERVEDDLGRALQAAARERPTRRSDGPAW